jgi:hypothetical protein
MSTTTVKISWQMTKSAQLSYFDNLHYKGVYHRNGVGNNNTNFSDNLARTLNTKWPNVQQVKFTTPYRSSFVFDVAYARLRDDDRFDPRPEVSDGAISRFDSATNTYTRRGRPITSISTSANQAHGERQLFRGLARHPRRLFHLRQWQAVCHLVDLGYACRLRERLAERRSHV